MPTPAAPPLLRDLLDRLTDDGRRRALTHAAYATTAGASYERLEFLGDSVLGCAIAAELFLRFPDMDEGGLSRLKASIVSREACALVARACALGDAMVAEAADPDVALARDLASHDRVLAALAESVIGACFLELGYDVVAPVIVASFADRIGHAVDNGTDSKSELQELAQRQGEAVEYRVVSIDGPDHDRTFTILARLGERGLEAVGEGRTKKAAEQLAARQLLAELREG